MSKENSNDSLTVGGRTTGAYQLLQTGEFNLLARDQSHVIRTPARTPD